MIQIHRIAIAYHKRPSELLFPNQLSSMLQLAIDNIIFNIGFTHERKLEMDFEIEKLKCLANIMGAKLT